MHYYEALEHGDVIKYSISITLVLLLIAILVFFFRHLFAPKEKIQNRPIYFIFSVKILKYISCFSTLFGTLGAITLSQRTMIKVSIVGEADFGAVAGPLSEALTPLIFGLSITCLGFVFSFFADWKNIRAFESQEDPKRASQSQI